jgi:WhiB family redox-sensing transcriptional regulator
LATAQPAEDDWRNDAACASNDTDLFFPVGTTADAVRQTEAVKEICGGCPAREACLDFALDTEQAFGIWGGLTEDERRVMKRRARRTT